MEKYEIVRTLGVGACGKAYLAKRKADGLQVSIKEMCLSGNENSMNEYQAEVSILKTLDHKFIIRYFEDFQEKENFYIVMEFADGGNLGDKIKASVPLCEAEVLNYFTQMLIALQHIHQKHILHRDLKSENIFLMKDGTVKIGDFGVSKVLASTVSLAMTQIGTPYYLSPEICKGKNYNTTSDVWSLGIILYELLSKKRPFDAGNLCALISQITTKQPPPIPPHFSNEMKDLVAKLLMKDPNARPKVTEIMNLPIIKNRLVNFLGMTMRGARFNPNQLFLNEETKTEEESKKIITDGKKRIESHNPEQQQQQPKPKAATPQLGTDERQNLFLTQRAEALANKQKYSSGADVMKEIEAGMKEQERVTKTAAGNSRQPKQSAEDVMKEINASMRETEKRITSSRKSTRPGAPPLKMDKTQTEKEIDQGIQEGSKMQRTTTRSGFRTPTPKKGGEQERLDQVAADIIGALESRDDNASSGFVVSNEGKDQRKALKTLLEKKIGAAKVNSILKCAKDQSDPAPILNSLDKTSSQLAQQLLILEIQ